MGLRLASPTGQGSRGGIDGLAFLHLSSSELTGGVGSRHRGRPRGTMYRLAESSPRPGYRILNCATAKSDDTPDLLTAHTS